MTKILKQVTYKKFQNCALYNTYLYLLITFVQLDSTPGLPTSFLRFNKGWYRDDGL